MAEASVVKRFNVGDLVIHANDAKEHRMVRVVVALLPDGRVRTVFNFKKELPENWRNRVERVWPSKLRNPRSFGISLARGGVRA